MARQLDDEKKRNILDEARRIFGERGYQATTIKQIAVAAHLAPGTVYTYFKNKEELFSAVVEDVLHRFISGIHSISVGGKAFHDKLVEFIDFGFSLLVEIHPLLRGMFSEANKRELLIARIDEVCLFISEFFREGASQEVVFGPVEDPELQRFNLNMMVSGILFRASLATPERLDQELDEIRAGLVSIMGERLKAGI